MCREEEFYEREEILGRDASSVFPTQAKTPAVLDVLKESIGVKKFISETEVIHLGPELLTEQHASLVCCFPLWSVCVTHSS